MPLTHDMGLIGFHLVMFANRVHMHLMPTELFVRRPLLWLAHRLANRAPRMLCSPNFGYRHYLKVLGDRSPGNLDLSRGAADLQRRRTHLGRALRGIPRRAWRRWASSAMRMYPVYGLAEASLAVSFPPVARPFGDAAAEPAPAGRRRRAPKCSAHASRDALGAGQRRQAPIPGCELRIAGDDDAALPDGTHRPHPDPRRQRDERLLRGAGSQRRHLHRRRLAAHRRSGPGARWRALHHRSRQGNHLRQRTELLPARPRSHRAARAGHGTGQGGGGRRAAARRGDRSAHGVRAASRRSRRISRAGRRRSRA